MAVVESTFNTTAGQLWATTSWDVANNPAGKLHTALDTWLNSLSGTDKFTLELHPGTSGVTRGTSDNVGWILKSTVGGGANNDYGFFYHFRKAGAVATSAVGPSYYNRTANSTNNYLGTYTTFTTAISNEDFSVAGTAYIIYETSGTTPWFVYSWTSDPTSTARHIHAISKLDTTNISSGSYYPTTGLGKWVYLFSNNSSSPNTSFQYVTPSINNASPYKGITTSSSPAYNQNSLIPYQDNYFFGFRPLYGDTHYLGNVTPDWLITTNTTGNLGDTATVNGISYRCLDVLWVRNA